MSKAGALSTPPIQADLYGWANIDIYIVAGTTVPCTMDSTYTVGARAVEKGYGDPSLLVL